MSAAALLMWLACYLPVLAMAGGYPCCCGPVLSVSYGPHANCFCCGDKYATQQRGGPLQFLVDFGTVTGSCSDLGPGGPCSPAGGLHYLDWEGPSAIPLVNCSWVSPAFGMCGGSANHIWIMTMNNFANCLTDSNNAVSIVLSQTPGSSFDAQYGSSTGEFSCNAASPLHRRTVLISGCTFPATISSEPVWN